LPEPGAKEGLHDNPLNPDADWMTFECVVGTEADQIAIAPGYLIKEETRGGRKYFHYKMDALIENFYAVVSARYEVLKENWNGISLEIYYHKGHDYNLRNMMKGMKDAITYASENFSPYQYRQARIIEFPRYEMFAQSFPNTIPFSEGMGFIADLRDSSEIDYAYYVTAHEIAHQWWGHQVLPSAQKGATMLVETMAQYTALMVMKKEYGPEKMRQFLKFELDSYLSRRGSEGEYELPLYRTTGQDYIHYRKGSVVMYALQDYWGEENLNRALHKFVMGTRYQTRPYPHSVSFLDTLKRYTPDSLQYLYKDMFEQITLYDNRTLSAVSEKLPNGKYKVILEIEGHKQLADSLGKETPLPLNDYIDIAVLGAETRGKYSDKQLYIQKHRIHEGKNTFEVVVDEEPKKAGIDVYNKLIDRDSDDNLMRITPK
jgi:aminopeptidase N